MCEMRFNPYVAWKTLRDATSGNIEGEDVTETTAAACVNGETLRAGNTNDERSRAGEYGSV